MAVRPTGKLQPLRECVQGPPWARTMIDPILALAAALAAQDAGPCQKAVERNNIYGALWTIEHERTY